MTDNPHQQTVILRGGPYDGELRELSASVVGYGRLIVPLPLEVELQMAATDDIHSKLRRGAYRRQHMAEGRFGTCEFRDWYEWHYEGEAV